MYVHTGYYVAVTPLKLARSFDRAGCFVRNVRTMEVLIDQAARRTSGDRPVEPWQYYDLRHGYCTYDFFNHCAHRMACAKCSFYQSKVSARMQTLELKGELQANAPRNPADRYRTRSSRGRDADAEDTPR